MREMCWEHRFKKPFANQCGRCQIKQNQFGMSLFYAESIRYLYPIPLSHIVLNFGPCIFCELIVDHNIGLWLSQSVVFHCQAKLKILAILKCPMVSYVISVPLYCLSTILNGLLLGMIAMSSGTAYEEDSASATHQMGCFIMLAD